MNNHKDNKVNLFKRAKDKVMSLVDWFMKIYNMVFESVLSLKAMHTYYDDPDAFIKRVSDKYLHLSAEELKKACETSPLEVVGEKRIKRVASKRIHLHARHVLFITALCAWPQSWIMWPLMVVDIVYFQMQVFAITQELHILYKRKEGYSGENKLNYTSLANMAVQMAGTQLKSKAIKQGKKIVGKIGKVVVKRGFTVVRASIQAGIRQVFKWCGITVTKDFVETTMTLLVSGLCALVGGLISYWLFVPMARKLENELRTSPKGEESAEEAVIEQEK